MPAGGAPVTLVNRDGSPGSGGSAGLLTTNDLRSTYGSEATVPTSTTSAVLLAANANRKGAQIVNLSAQALLIRYNPTGTASATEYWTRVAAGGEHTVDFGYSGRITGVLESGTGNARVTELV